ncbi:MAG: putative metalloprotease CJM1_0395 family protein [Campylobacterota bacterium]|nr:putative metalloprotease CJM1_0395 family protein [Campylobacterota bacterium]
MDVITDNFDKMSINQIYSQLSSKYDKLAKIEEKEQVEATQKKDYIEQGSPTEKYDDKSFARVLEKFKQADANIRSHEQIHASIGHTTAPIAYTYQEGPDGKMYAVGGHVKLDTSIPDDPKAAAFKLDMLQKAASGPIDSSAADNTIASQSNLNKILLQLKGEENAS